MKNNSEAQLKYQQKSQGGGDYIFVFIRYVSHYVVDCSDWRSMSL